MASREFHDFQERIAAQGPPAPTTTLEERRAQIDDSFGSAPLASGVIDESIEMGGVPSIWLRRQAKHDAPVVCYFHGGGYRMGSAKAWRPFASHLAAVSRARVLVVDYRLAPEHAFPAAVDDAVAAYRGLLDAGEDPRQIVLAGDSAGGGLAAATLLAARKHGLPYPAGAALLSPWVDLTNSAETFVSNAEKDQLFSFAQANQAASLYLADQDRRHVLASPVFADWQGMPPLLIQAGDAEVLLDDARNLAARAESTGVDVRLSIYPDMPHVWHLSYPAFPEATRAVDEIAAFVANATHS